MSKVPQVWAEEFTLATLFWRCATREIIDNVPENPKTKIHTKFNVISLKSH